jgi:hypothetical protein
MYSKIIEEKDKSSATNEVNNDEQTVPDEFISVKGVNIKVFGNQSILLPVVVSMGSNPKIIGNFIRHNQIIDSKSLLEKIERFYDSCAQAEDSRKEVSSLVFPIDLAELKPEMNGLIIDENLKEFENGFKWLCDSSSSSSANNCTISNALEVLYQFVRTMKFLWDYDYVLNLWDGHQLYFNFEYRTFRFLIDFHSVTNKADWNRVQDPLIFTNSNIANVILHALTGSWSDNVDQSIVIDTKRDSNNSFTFNELSREIDGPDHLISVWKSLSKNLQQAFIQTCFQNHKQYLEMDDWLLYIKEAIDSIDVCPYCKSSVIKTSSHCLICRHSLSRSELLTKWKVENEEQPFYFRLTFGRGTEILGGNISLQLGNLPLMKLMYNSKENSLGLKNLSLFDWEVFNKETKEIVSPGEIVKIEKGVLIKFYGYYGIQMTFLDFET